MSDVLDVLQEDKTERRNNLIAITITIIGFVIAFFLKPDDVGSFGVYGCLLLVIPITYTFLTERMIEAFVISGLLGAMLFTKENFIFEYPYKLIETLTDEDTLWVILILAIMACLTQLLQISGGMTAFVDLVGKKIKSRRGVLVLSWFTSLFFFFDDYLNILLRGGTLRNLTDKHKISREMLAYVVDSTAAAVCILVPISTWAVYVAGLFEMVGYAPAGEGIAYFIKTIPFNFYAWFVLLVCLLVCLGIIPVFGPMKKAEREASLVLEIEIRKQEIEEVENHKVTEENNTKKPKIINFLIPILVLSAVTIMTEIDVLLGSFAALAFTFFFFTIQKLVKLDAFGEACIYGIKRMLQPIILLIVCFANASYFLETGFSDWHCASKWNTTGIDSLYSVSCSGSI